MLQKYNTGSVLIYTLVLVVLSLIMAMVILGIAGLLASSVEMQEITRKLSNNVLSKGKLSLKYDKIVNSNGSGFVDTLGCPSSVTMSGTIFRTTGTPVLTYETDSIFCKGSHNGNDYKIYFLSGSISDTIADFEGDSIDISGGIGDRVFLDGDTTLMRYDASLPTSSDSIDDDFNSDNYLASSTGVTMYPSGYQDDDTSARKLLYGYANPGVGFANMMWNNSEVSTYIDNNSNNSDSLNEKIASMTSSGIAYLDINQNHRLKLYVLDKSIYNLTKEIITTSAYEGADSLGGLGYLQENSGVLSISSAKTGNEFTFDFATNDYAIFVRNNSTGALLYRLNIETTTGTGVYVNPIDDSDSSVLKVLANDIIIDNEGRFLYEQFEVIDFK